jgi:hypothetical protein
MKQLILITIIAISQFGCSIAPKANAVKAASEQNEYVGLDKNSEFSVSVPSSHSGPYSSIDQFNFQIEKGMYNDYEATAIMGKSRKTETWEVLVFMINENGSWIELPRTN